MFNDALKEVTGLLDRRFLLNIFFPCLVFYALLIIVVILGAGKELSTVTVVWSQQETGIQILQVIGFLSAVTVFSGIIDSQLSTIIRFYEGYPPLNLYLATIGKSFHQHRLEQLVKVEKEKFAYLQSHYPPYHQIDQVMPTQLGNILKNSELYPSDRYGLDAVVIWPRLYHLFPDRFAKTIAETKGIVDFMLVVSTLSSIFVLITSIYLLVINASFWLFLLCFWGGLVIACLAYRGALASAVLYAHQIKTGFDLYRYEIFKQMNLQLPSSLKDEKEQWKKINQFLYQNFPLPPGYMNTQDAISNSKENEN